MKRISLKLLLAFALVPFVYTACNEKNIDLAPTTETESSYFQEEQHFEKAVLGNYAKLTDLFWYAGGAWIHGLWLLPGDDITTTANGNPFEVFYNIQPSTGAINTFYTTLYQLVNRSNTLIEKIDQVADGIYVTPGLKDANKGEATFLRGYAYFLLWNYFGTSPLITERIQSTDKITPPNSQGNQLLDQAIADFQAAEALLPTSWPDRNRGRVTKSSANGFLGKALVFRATVTKNNADYTAAIAAFNKITDKSLVPAFDDNFSVYAENNAESLFEYQASQPSFDNVWLSNDFDNPIGSISAYYGYYENHYSLFGTPIFRGTTKLFDAYEYGDPRRDLTVKRDPDPNIDYQIQKYWTKDQKSQSGVASVNNERILRYADVLLLKAEAIVQSDGSTADAINLINEVRTRARNMVAGNQFPANRSVTETNRATIMDWIRTERFLELAGEEGHRWLDLRRWHLGGQIDLATWNFSSVIPDAKFDVGKNLLLPIPTSEIDLNPNIVQNPGF